MKSSLPRQAPAMVLAALLASPIAAVAAPTVTTLVDGSVASATALVNALLAPASGISVVAGSASYVGAPTASGTFTNGGTGATGVGIDTGVVLTSGDARFIGSSAAFAGDDANKSGTFTAGVGNSLTTNNSPGNSLFASLAGASGSANASILAFQFIPQGSFLRLSFVFGSEDYNDVVNSGFPTDVFGIFVNGVNYALVPGTSTPISASSVNCGGPTSGAAPGGGQNCGLFRDNAPFFGTIDSEVDGFTTRFTLAVPVNSGTVNTLQLGIADTLDSSGDSALLLQAASIGVAAVPEPSTYALMIGGLLAVANMTRRRRGARS
jgi:PEP-CTERM motif